jgi:hypothetical protein
LLNTPKFLAPKKIPPAENPSPSLDEELQEEGLEPQPSHSTSADQTPALPGLTLPGLEPRR